MRVRGRITEDFTNYKRPGLYVPCCYCDFKCCHDCAADKSMCQNSMAAEVPITEIDDNDIMQAYSNSLIAKAVIFGGFEPFWQIDEIEQLLKKFRAEGIHAPFVIYTGYTECEVMHLAARLFPYGDIIIKYGRYRPNEKEHMDDVLGVRLASNNQYAKSYALSEDNS